MGKIKIKIIENNYNELTFKVKLKNPNLVLLIIFSLFVLFFDNWLISHILIAIKNNNVQEEAKNFAYYLFIPINLLFVFLFIVYFLYNLKIQIDLSKNILNLYKFKILRNKFVMEKNFNINDIDFFCIVWIKDYKVIDEYYKNDFNIYIIYKDNACLKLERFSSSDKAHEIGMLIANKINVELKDFTDLDYDNEFDFLKLYKQYEKQNNQHAQKVLRIK